MGSVRKNLVFSVYRMLRVIANANGIMVWDTHQDGPGLTMWNHPKRTYRPAKYTIIIGFYPSLKKRMFALAHELGHVMKMAKMGEHIVLVPRKTPCREEKANETAVRFLSMFNHNWMVEFAQFYDWANRHSTRRKRMTDGETIKEEKGHSNDHGPWEGNSKARAKGSTRKSYPVRNEESKLGRVMGPNLVGAGTKVHGKRRRR